jgi:hypothetical protein
MRVACKRDPNLLSLGCWDNAGDEYRGNDGQTVVTGIKTDNKCIKSFGSSCFQLFLYLVFRAHSASLSIRCIYKFESGVKKNFIAHSIVML